MNCVDVHHHIAILVFVFQQESTQVGLAFNGAEDSDDDGLVEAREEGMAGDGEGEDLGG